MRKILFFVFLCISIFIVGCAYFNTFYNARMFYDRAADATEKNKTNTLTPDEQSNYQKAVEKALLLLENYPDSKWADDAHLVLGKSYYFLKDYPSSERRLNELIANYPVTPLLNEAKFWLAKTKVATDRFQEAENDLNTLASQKITKKEKGEIYFFQAKIYDNRKNYQKAIETYQNALNADADRLGAKAWFAIGNDYDSLGVFDSASSAFRQVMKWSPEPELAFDAQFRYARAEKELGRFDGAVRSLEKLAGDEKNKTKVPILRLEIADCLDLKGDVNGAIITYQDIIQANPNTDYSAEASYWLGDLYEKQKKDYDRALDNYSQVKKQSARSIYADSAEIKGRDILRFKALKQVIGMALRGEKGEAVEVGSLSKEDTLGQVRPDTSRQNPSMPVSALRGVTPEMNNRTGEPARILSEEDAEMRARSNADSTKDKKPKIAENPELKSFNKDEIDKNLFLTAELYLFRFHIPDSAMGHFRILTQKFPQSPYAPQALYDMGYIYDTTIRDSSRADSCFRELVKGYPDSPYARGVLKRLGLERIASKEDSVAQMFWDAEKTFFDKKNPREAAQKYLDAWKRFPKSSMAAKALYSAGWIYENALDSLDLAFVLYDSLVNRYPGTPFAEKARGKVQAVKTEKSKPVQPEQKGIEKQNQTPEIKQPVRTGEEQKTTGADSSRAPEKPVNPERTGESSARPQTDRPFPPADSIGKSADEAQKNRPID